MVCHLVALAYVIQLQICSVWLSLASNSSPSYICSQNHLNLVVVNNVPLFFNIRDGPYMPTLRLLHQCKIFFVNNIITYLSYRLLELVVIYLIVEF